jgi:two-component system, chemotaxis family, protein-glutamate methylesterase/glutaminase
MPTSVLEYVQVDHSVPSGQMGALLGQLTSRPVPKHRKSSPHDLKRLQTEIVIATRDNAFEMGVIEMGELTAYTCPECHGAL